MSRGLVETPGVGMAMYYYGAQLTHARIGMSGVSQGIGRLTLRQEGFMGLTTDFSRVRPQGWLVTKPISLAAARQACPQGTLVWQLNVDTSIAGEVPRAI